MNYQHVMDYYGLQQEHRLQESSQCKSQIRLIQTDRNYCQAAQDLLSQTIRDKASDVAIIKEPYRNHGGTI